MPKRSKKKKGVGNRSSAQGAVPQHPPWFNRDWLGYLILIVAVILAYQPVWVAGYIWDDDHLITENPVVIGPLGLKEIWTTSVVKFCPLVFTTFWMEHALWGLTPLPYHLVNVFMHGACAILLWQVLRSLQVPGAWLGATLWALHPVEVESVAWVSELKNTQSCLFFLLSILFFVKWLKTGKGQKGSQWNYGFSLLCAALAMASKSSTVILPLVLCLCAWWVEGRWSWRHLARLAPIFLISLIAGALTIWMPKQDEGTGPQWVQSWPERLVTAGDAVWFYLGKLIWPHPLITIYPRWEIDASQGASYLPLLAVLMILLILWWQRRSWARPYFFAWAYFLVALLPILGLVNMGFSSHSFVADHFQYLAAIGPLALVGAGMVRWAESAIPGRWGLQASLATGLLLLLGVLSWQRTWAYKNEETLWVDTLAQNPNCWAGQGNLGNALAHRGQVDEAIVQYQKALEINPNIAETRNNLGNALAQKGRVDEAIVQFQKALEINPDMAEAHSNLGNALMEKGRIDEAIVQYQKAVEINPNLANARNGLSLALEQKRQLDQAAARPSAK